MSDSWERVGTVGVRVKVGVRARNEGQRVRV